MLFRLELQDVNGIWNSSKSMYQNIIYPLFIIIRKLLVDYWSDYNMR